jgi:hypothetical protein
MYAPEVEQPWISEQPWTRPSYHNIKGKDINPYLKNQTFDSSNLRKPKHKLLIVYNGARQCLTSEEIN